MLRLRSQLISLIIILVVIFLPTYSRLQQLRFENKALEEKIEKIKQDSLALIQEKQKLEKDPFYLEKVAREKLGVVRKGEIVYRVVPETKDKKTNSGTDKK